MGKMMNAYRILVGKGEGKRPLGRRRRKCVDKIEMDLIEIGWYGLDWIDMAQDRDHCRGLVNTVLNLRVLKCWEVLEWLHNWRLLKKVSAP
jgi:hypothetical protein